MPCFLRNKQPLNNNSTINTRLIVRDAIKNHYIRLFKELFQEDAVKSNDIIIACYNYYLDDEDTLIYICRGDCKCKCNEDKDSTDCNNKCECKCTCIPRDMEIMQYIDKFNIIPVIKLLNLICKNADNNCLVEWIINFNTNEIDPINFTHEMREKYSKIIFTGNFEMALIKYLVTVMTDINNGEFTDKTNNTIPKYEPFYDVYNMILFSCGSAEDTEYEIYSKPEFYNNILRDILFETAPHLTQITRYV